MTGDFMALAAIHVEATTGSGFRIPVTMAEKTGDIQAFLVKVVGNDGFIPLVHTLKDVGCQGCTTLKVCGPCGTGNQR